MPNDFSDNAIPVGRGNDCWDLPLHPLFYLQHAASRCHLEATLSDLRGGPAFFARQNRGWARKAKRLLARLPRA